MKVANLVGSRFKEKPSDCVIDSHALMVRGGYMKYVGNGIYSEFPTLRRVTSKIENIIRQEMDAIDGQEVLFPVVLPADLWDESGRYESVGSELLRFTDRNDARMVLGMTHEEAAVQLVREYAQSYTKYPFMIYQFQRKFRDEARPRAGMIRVREFTMKDAYSFHTLRSGSISIRFTRSRVTISNSLAELLYSTGFPAAAMIQPDGTGWVPNVLFCRNCSIVGTSVSDTQLISSIKRIPSLQPVSSIFS